MPKYIEKVQVLLTDGIILYFDDKRMAKAKAELHLRTLKKSAGERIAWINEDEAFLIGTDGIQKTSEVILTPMLIPVSEWKDILEKTIYHNNG